MPYTDGAKNIMLTALTALVTHVSVHSAAPGSTGASEISGSVRGAVTWNTAAAGAATISGTASVGSIPAVSTVKYLGLWSASTGGTFYGYQLVPDTTTASGLPWTFIVATGELNLNATASA